MPRRLTPAQIERMLANPQWPDTVAEVLDDNAEYSADVLRAVKAYARSKPWRGTLEERIVKLQTLHAALCAAYDRQPVLDVGRLTAADASAGAFDPANDIIYLGGKLSVVTYLHQFGHALGKTTRQACRWSLNLFRRCFPRSFERAQQVGPFLVLRRDPEAEIYDEESRQS